MKVSISADVDRFSHLAIYTAVRCLVAGGRTLWDRHNNHENLLFRETDFQKPWDSVVLQELWSNPEPKTRALVGQLYVIASQVPLDRVPLLDEIVTADGIRLLTRDDEQEANEAMLHRYRNRPDLRPRFATNLPARSIAG